jgi:hypothetical protein
MDSGIGLLYLLYRVQIRHCVLAAEHIQYVDGIMVFTVMNRSVAYLVYENSDQGLGH